MADTAPGATPRKAPARKATAAKAAGTVAAGGGPENPAAVAAAAGQVRADGKARKTAKAAARKPREPDYRAPKMDTGSRNFRTGSSGTREIKSGPPAGLKLPGSAKAPSKVLTTEFLVCITVLGAGTLLAPSGSKDGVPRLMTRGTGLCLLFLILALIGSSGPKAGRAASALGGLVTVSYLVLSSDATNVFHWMTAFFGPAPGSGVPPAGAGAGPTSPPEAPSPRQGMTISGG